MTNIEQPTILKPIIVSLCAPYLVVSNAPTKPPMIPATLIKAVPDNDSILLSPIMYSN